MQVDQLRAALAVAEELSFRKAAARLHLSQPALSERVARLESTLKVRLFERGPDGTRLTPEGERLLPVIESAVRAMRDVVIAAAEVRPRDRHRRQLRVGVLIDGIDALTWPVLRAANDAWCDLELVVVPLMWRAIVPALIERRVDVVLGRGPFGDARLDVRTVGWGRVGATMTERHPLADAEVVELDDLLARADIIAPAGVDPTMGAFWFPAPNQRGHRLDGDGLDDFARLARLGPAGLYPAGIAASLPFVGLTFRPLRTPLWAPLQVLSTGTDPLASAFQDLAERTAAEYRPLTRDLVAVPA